MSCSARIPEAPAVDDRRTVPLFSPRQLREDVPASAEAAALVERTRGAVRAILESTDDRLIVIAGPCSIHDAASARLYAAWLARHAAEHAEDLLLVMRVFVEKARTRNGWKGLLYDPAVDGGGGIAEGLRAAREIQCDVLDAGVPIAAELLDELAAPYLIDLVSWAAVGARTVTSPPHRWMASGWPCAAGFKNALDGDVEAAINAALVAREPHQRFTIGDDGRVAVEWTPGNASSHVVLRGGTQPNFSVPSIESAEASMRQAGLDLGLLVDCSHGNNVSASEAGQVAAATEVARQIAAGSRGIAGVLLESHLLPGRQEPVPSQSWVGGLSVTDPCLGLDDTAVVLETLAAARRERVARNGRAL